MTGSKYTIKVKVLILLISALSISSCLELETPEPVLPDAFENMLVSPDFNWNSKSLKEIVIHVPEDDVISITSTDNKAVYAKARSHKQEFTSSLLIPSYLEKLNIHYQKRVETILVHDNINIEHTFTNSFTLKADNTDTLDSDNDGITDLYDDFPMEASLAFKSKYPAEYPGILTFEDTWPAKADYDFNDMVIQYQFSMLCNAQGYVNQIIGEFQILNIGASYTNGFGFQFLHHDYQWYQSLDGVVSNSFESEQVHPTVMLFEASDHQYENLKFTVNFDLIPGRVQKENINIHDWNPFITVNGIRNKEVHLPFHPPTDKADLNYFGSGSDDSNTESKSPNNKTYLTKTNLPWALDLNNQFLWTNERVSIDKGYNYFTSWVLSQGNEYDDWYLPFGKNGAEGDYRNTSDLDSN